MSRNTKIVMGTVLALGLTVGAWTVFGDHKAKPTPTPEPQKVTETMPAPKAVQPVVPVTAPEHKAAAIPANVGKAVDVTWYELRPIEQKREGESDARFSLRTEMVRKFNEFVGAAKLTAEQREKTLAILADLQAEDEILQDEMLDLHHKNEPGDYVGAMHTISRNTADRLREVLSPEQMNELDNYFGLETLEKFVVAKPFDLKTTPTK